MFVVLFLIVALIIILVISIFVIIGLVIGIREVITGDKMRGYSFIFLALLFIGAIGYFFFSFTPKTEPQLSNKEVTDLLKKENIRLDHDFKILHSKQKEDLYFYNTAFEIQIDSKDFENLTKSQLHDQSCVLKTVINDQKFIHDTLKISLTKNGVLRYYKSQHDYTN